MLRFLTLLVCSLVAIPALAVDDLTAAMRVSAAGMKLQNERLKVISQNIANVDSAGLSPNEDPYRRKILMVKNEFDEDLQATVVKVDKIERDPSDFILKYQPQHPAADKNGYVKFPNVHNIIENVDAKEAQRTFDANLTALEIAKTNQNRLIEALK